MLMTLPKRRNFLKTMRLSEDAASSLSSNKNFKRQQHYFCQEFVVLFSRGFSDVININ